MPSNDELRMLSPARRRERISLMSMAARNHLARMAVLGVVHRMRIARDAPRRVRLTESIDLLEVAADLLRGRP